MHLCVCVLCQHSAKSGTEGIIYEETNCQSGADAVSARGAAALFDAGAAAASRVDAAPYASVEYAKYSGVKAGTVRYISQVPSYTDQFCADYWGSYVGYANHECFTACISHGPVLPRHRCHARRARRLLAQLRALRRALCHDAGGCCFQRARRTARPRWPRPSRATSAARAATVRRSFTSTAIQPTATMS